MKERSYTFYNFQTWINRGNFPLKGWELVQSFLQSSFRRAARLARADARRFLKEAQRGVKCKRNRRKIKLFSKENEKAFEKLVEGSAWEWTILQWNRPLKCTRSGANFPSGAFYIIFAFTSFCTLSLSAQSAHFPFERTSRNRNAFLVPSIDKGSC